MCTLQCCRERKTCFIDCPFYQDIRFELFESCQLACSEFETFNADDKLNFILEKCIKN